MSSQSSTSIPQAAPSRPAAETTRGEARLRLWPGVAIVALLWIIREGSLLLPPSPLLFRVAYMFTPMVATALALIWWLSASGLRLGDRLLIGGLFTAAAAITGYFSWQYLGMGLFLYILPTVLTLWVGWLLVTYRLAWAPRRLGLVVLLILAFCFAGALRIDGMDGSFNPQFNMRWTPTPEDRLLASLAAQPHPASDPSAAAEAQPADSAPLELSPGDWPGFRGPNRDGRLPGVSIATDWNSSPPKPLWRHLIGPGWSSIAVIGNRLYTQEQRGENELVVCYDASTGEELWVHTDPTRFTEVVAGPGPRGTPTFDSGKIYAQGANGKLNCLDAATGRAIWSRDIMAESAAKLPMWGFASSPLVAQGIVSVFAGGPDGKSLLAYNAETGEPAWSAGEGTLSYSSPQLSRLGGVEQLLFPTDRGLTSYQPETGAVLWTYDWPTDGVARVIQPAVLEESDILIGTGLGVGTRRIHVGHDGDTWPIEVRWTTAKLKPYYNDFVVAGDNLYGFNDNVFLCMGLDDAKVRWHARGYGNGQVLLLTDQNLLVVLSETGEVALVDAQPDKHHEVARFKAIEGKTWNHPVIAHNRLFVRNGEEIACFELTPLAADQARAPAESTVQ